MCLYVPANVRPQLLITKWAIIVGTNANTTEMIIAHCTYVDIIVTIIIETQNKNTHARKITITSK